MMIANDIQAANATLPGKLKVLHVTTPIMMLGAIHAHTQTRQFTQQPGSVGNDNYVDYNAARCKVFAGRKRQKAKTTPLAPPAFTHSPAACS